MQEHMLEAANYLEIEKASRQCPHDGNDGPKPSIAAKCHVQPRKPELSNPGSHERSPPTTPTLPVLLLLLVLTRDDDVLSTLNPSTQ